VPLNCRLYGSANVTSYDLMPKSQLAELPADEVQAGQDDIKWARVSRQGDFVAECTMWLDPRRFNLHQIRANDQIGCALLDIMIPPYNKYDPFLISGLSSHSGGTHEWISLVL
jgi:hypothetical protein